MLSLINLGILLLIQLRVLLTFAAAWLSYSAYCPPGPPQLVPSQGVRPFQVQDFAFVLVEFLGVLLGPFLQLL